jgi:hypothetical protein
VNYPEPRPRQIPIPNQFRALLFSINHYPPECTTTSLQPHFNLTSRPSCLCCYRQEPHSHSTGTLVLEWHCSYCHRPQNSPPSILCHCESTATASQLRPRPRTPFTWIRVRSIFAVVKDSQSHIDVQTRWKVVSTKTRTSTPGAPSLQTTYNHVPTNHHPFLISSPHRSSFLQSCPSSPLQTCTLRPREVMALL